MFFGGTVEGYMRIGIVVAYSPRIRPISVIYHVKHSCSITLNKVIINPAYIMSAVSHKGVMINYASLIKFTRVNSRRR